ncbi:hypothetical protein QFZ27_001650 [Inquilinus ginsengisoli]|uniref:hypothetical protein n=1 Tax=Inquilinus ginsengisoli TaxID=363840 RepID=UPI003D2548F3
MIPSVHAPVSIEMIRDGGSLTATFTSDEGKRFILFIGINTRKIDEAHRENLGYHSPIVIDADPSKRLPDTDSVVYSELGGPSVPISWSEARSILVQVSRLIGELTPWQEKWLHKMRDVVNFDGAPPGFPETYRVFRPPPRKDE